MKKLKLVFAILLLSLAACGKSAATGKTIETVRTAYVEAGYTVNDATIANVSALTGSKDLDIITVLFTKSSSDAKKLLPTYENAASLVGHTCKQDEKNIYYGTAPAMAIYEAIGTTPNSISLSSNVSTGVSTSISGSQSTINRITDWSSDTKALLMEYVGEVIPVAPLSTEYSVEENDELWIVDNVGGDITNQYATILKNAGYTYDEEISSEYGIESYYKDSAVEEDGFLIIDFYYEENEMIIIVSLYAPFSGEYITEWSEDLEELMMTHLGEVIPVAPYSENHTYEYSEEDDCIYILDDEVGDVGDIYAEILEEEGYIYDEEESGYDEDDDFWYCFSKETAEGVIYIDVYFYTAYGSMGINAYFISGDGGGIVVGGSVTLTASNFTEVSYVDNDKTHTFGSLKVTTLNIMQKDGTIQFRNNSGGHGTMSNTVAVAIATIKLTITIGSLANVVVSAGSSASNLTTVTGTGGLYDLKGATFFKITTVNSGVINFSSIVFTFTE